ncbi:SHOCT domain-containing protein [Iamia majanohamensis]|uniref:SHOCT domain-containing protein n=1 Tax=Iamia majanohamensis TaxID=467976 RepID=A0AAF0BU18_9ACTN|nr:SHOCT domain-containing protein [Iamia majanohamensis]WCO65049.1 SHOCT domain-containing protein [Iamia majanohamensis]
MTEARWVADPTGRHELRYWDGGQWTDHVSDGSHQSTDPLLSGDAAPGTAIELVSAVELTQAEPAPEPPRDPNLLWEGTSRSLKGAATGGFAGAAAYRVTRDGIHWDVGRLTSRSQQAHIAYVSEVHVNQTMTQKSRGVGSVTVLFTNGGSTVLADVAEPHRVRDIINAAAADYRSHAWERDRQMNAATASNISISQGVPAAGADPTPSVQVSIAQQLRELAELRDAGVLTEDEFTQQKSRLLQ